MILGDNVICSTDPEETGLNNNVIVCGSSGSGKTMSVFEPRLLETFESSVVATVTKRKVVNKYSKLFKDRGYEVLDMNFTDLKSSNVSYDPLKFLKSYTDITFLANSIVQSNPKKLQKNNADPYWDEAAASLLSAEIAFVLMTKHDATFEDVLKFHCNLEFKSSDDQITTNYDEKFEMLADIDPNCYAVSCWKTFFHLPIRTANCVFSSLNTTIDTIFTPELRKTLTAKDPIDVKSLAQKKTILFITTSAVNPSLHCFVNIFYSQMFKTLFEYSEELPSGRLPIPVNVLCDDFATGSRILNFPEYISIFREKQISVTLLIQSESQLKSMYDDDSVTIINNCDTYVYMGGMDLQTGKNISERLNIPLDEVLYMPIGQEFVFRRGSKPIITQRYSVKKNELYRSVTSRYEKEIARKERLLDK